MMVVRNTDLFSPLSILPRWEFTVVERAAGATPISCLCIEVVQSAFVDLRLCTSSARSVPFGGHTSDLSRFCRVTFCCLHDVKGACTRPICHVCMRREKRTKEEASSGDTIPCIHKRESAHAARTRGQWACKRNAPIHTALV